MHCPKCDSQRVVKNGKITLQQGITVQKYVITVQKYVCKACRKQFNDRSGTPMARLQTSPTLVASAMNVRTEGAGGRATGRSFGR